MREKGGCAPTKKRGRPKGNESYYFWKIRYDEYKRKSQNLASLQLPQSTTEKAALKKKKDKLWGVVRVIATAEEKIPCQFNECSKEAAMSWVCNKDPEDLWNLCEGCQFIEFGGFGATGKSNSAPPELMAEPEDSFVFAPIPTSSISSFQDWITTQKRSWRTDNLPKIKDAIEARNSNSAPPESMAEPEEVSFVFPPIPTSSISSFQDWITTRKISWKRKRNQLAIDPTSAPDSFVFPPIPTSSILSFQDWITTRKRSWRTDYLPKIKDAIEARNIHYFNNHFAFQFPDIPKEEKNTNTVTVIPESNPKAIFKARVNNAVMTLPLAPPEDDCTFCQVGGKLPVTDELYDGFTVTGHGICHIFKEENWDGCIGVGKYYPHDFTPEIAADFAGGPKRKIWMDMQRHMDG